MPRTCFKNNFYCFFFPKYKSNKYYCRILETVIKILKRKIKFAPYSTFPELQAHEAHSRGDLWTEKASTALRSEARLGFIGIRFLAQKFYFLPHRTPSLVSHLYHLTLISVFLESMLIREDYIDWIIKKKRFIKGWRNKQVAFFSFDFWCQTNFSVWPPTVLSGTCMRVRRSEPFIFRLI